MNQTNQSPVNKFSSSRNHRLFWFSQGLYFLLLLNLIQPVYAAGSSQDPGSKGFIQLIILAILIPGFFIGVLYALRWAFKRSRSSVRNTLIDRSNLPKDTKIITFDFPFFFLYFLTLIFYVAFIGFFSILGVFTAIEYGIYPTVPPSSVIYYFLFIVLPFIVFITSALFIYHPLRKVIKLQSDTDNRENTFFYARFFLIIGFCFVLFFGLSLGFELTASNSNPQNGVCDVCGGYASYEYTINNVKIHNFCFGHALVFAIFHPFVPIESTIKDDPIEGGLPLLYDAYFWFYGIGLAIIAGKRYGWSGS